MRTACNRIVVSPQLKILTLTAVLLVIAGGLICEAQTITEINPSQSTLWATDPDGASGGRVNHLGVAPTNKNIIFAASEWGGIYKSTDRGQTWTRMNGHLPTVTWDVKMSPLDSNRVIATSFYDGRVNSLAGINLSTDGGVTWTHPASATPPSGFCVTAARRSEPEAQGISFDPEHPQNVYVGTSCGLAISNDGGNTWHYVDPTPADKADSVWSVVVHHGGTIDICGDDGHRRSTDGGGTWTSTSGSGTPLAAGRCSITASPDESYVLFAVVGTTIFESDNGGGSWTPGAYTNPAPQGRIPFVKTNSRATNQYDLWFGDVSLFRGSCTTPSPAAPGGSKRCNASSSWAGGFTRSNGAHDDMGDVALDPSPGEGVDPACQQDCQDGLRDCEQEKPKQQCLLLLHKCILRCKKVPLKSCPLAMSSDGGVFVNTVSANPACQTPKWGQPNVTPHGLWLFGMNSAHAATGAGASLYFGNQDDGTFAATDAQTGSPTWSNHDCCDSFDVAADTNQVLYTVCCFGGRANRLFLRDAGMTGGGEVNTYPTGNLIGFRTPDVVDRFGSNEYVVLTDAGVFITTNITADPISWSQLGAKSNPPGGCAVHASVSGSTPSFFVETGGCTGSGEDQIWRYDGTATSGTWTQVNPPAGFSGFGVFAVDKQNPNRMFASVLSSSTVRMVISTNGGTSWSNLSALDTAMTGGGIYQYRNVTGPTDFTGFNGYVQPTLVAFAPFNSNTLVAAGADSGVFLSTDTGTTWKKVTDNSGTAGNPQVPRAKFASFDQQDGTVTTFIGTQGRGVWKFETCGLTLCSGVCVNTLTNTHNCGSCGNACAIGQRCAQGVCGCPAGTSLCCGGDLGCRQPGKCPKQCP